MFLNKLKISQLTSPFRSKLILHSYREWIKQNEKILDIGCGTGITAKVIDENLKVKIFGCDVENSLVYDLPFRHIPKNGKLPFKDKEFESAMLNDVLHHIGKQSQARVINEALRVAKKVLIFEAEPTWSAKVFDTILNTLHYRSLDLPLTFRGSKDWMQLFESLKLEYNLKKINKPFWYPFSHMAILIKKRTRKPND